ncbi:MAG TPA: DUF3307 domain-containing protein [Flavisolibacter sp.]|nr:DUF3307 domain-containing protein [Flavisolibacter sp.]
MDIYIIWLTKLILAHLITDFILQPTQWIKSRNEKHFRSGYLYIHGLTTALAALLFIGYTYWIVVLIILVTHILIDGWKSYRPDKVRYFLIDQALHLAIILGCWYFTFLHPEDIRSAWQQINNRNTWVLLTSFIFLTRPCGILIGQLTQKWRAQIPDADSLGNAGKWIGIIERIIILVLVLNHQYASVGLLITAKSLLRFNEPNRLEVKTEYLLIGTLISFSIAILTGIVALQLTA